jgi:hypothetical protein
MLGWRINENVKMFVFSGFRVISLYYNESMTDWLVMVASLRLITHFVLSLLMQKHPKGGFRFP